MTDLFTLIISDPIGRWFLYVGIALGAVVVVGLLVLRAFTRARDRLDVLGEELGIVRHEVKNDHPTNLRVEQDHRHDENKSLLTGVDKKLDKVLGILGAHDYRLNELEETLDRRGYLAARQSRHSKENPS